MLNPPGRPAGRGLGEMREELEYEAKMNATLPRRTPSCPKRAQKCRPDVLLPKGCE